jgi:hypothetical protein
MKLRFALQSGFTGFIAIAVVGCSSTGAGTAAPSCTTGAAETVPLVQVAADPPSPQGGTVVLGTYVLTDYTSYTGTGGKTGPTGTSVSSVLVLDTNAYRSWVSTDNPPTSAGTYASHTTTLTVFLTCPQSRVDHLPYTASPTSIQIFNPAGVGTVVSTYTLQCQAGAFPGTGC